MQSDSIGFHNYSRCKWKIFQAYIKFGAIWYVWVWYFTHVMDWPKNLFSFLKKIKDTFFIFTNNFIDLDILSMSAISHVE